MASHCFKFIFSFHFFDVIGCETSFQVFIYHLYILFGEGFVKGYDIFFNQSIFFLLSFKISLYILDNSPLKDVSSANNFSQAVAYGLVLLTLYLAGQKFLILVKDSLLFL